MTTIISRAIQTTRIVVRHRENNMETPNTLITVKEGAAYLRVSRECLYRKIEAGELPVYRIGRVLRLDLNDIKTWARQNKT